MAEISSANFEPVIIWQRENFRIVQIETKKFVIEQCNLDAMRQVSWHHHLSIEDQPSGGASKVLWLYLMSRGL